MDDRALPLGTAMKRQYMRVPSIITKTRTSDPQRRRPPQCISHITCAPRSAAQIAMHSCNGHTPACPRVGSSALGCRSWGSVHLSKLNPLTRCMPEGTFHSPVELDLKLGGENIALPTCALMRAASVTCGNGPIRPDAPATAASSAGCTATAGGTAVADVPLCRTTADRESGRTCG